jgi:hypothetical protein
MNVVPRDYTVDPKRWAFRMDPYEQGINMENPYPAEWCQDMLMVEPFDYEDAAQFYLGWPQSFNPVIDPLFSWTRE